MGCSRRQREKKMGRMLRQSLSVPGHPSCHSQGAGEDKQEISLSGEGRRSTTFQPRFVASFPPPTICLHLQQEALMLQCPERNVNTILSDDTSLEAVQLILTAVPSCPALQRWPVQESVYCNPGPQAAAPARGFSSSAAPGRGMILLARQ